MFRGLSREDAARFSFLLATPVILAAGVLKIPDLTGSLGDGIRGQVLFGSALSFVGAYVALRFLVRYFRPRAHADAVRDLLPGRGPGLRHLPVGQVSGPTRPSRSGQPADNAAVFTLAPGVAQGRVKPIGSRLV